MPGVLDAAVTSGRDDWSYTVGRVVDAPGAVVATSTKADLVHLTAFARATTGRVHVFDPDRLLAWPTPCRWNIVAGCQDVREAMTRARAMVAASDGSLLFEFRAAAIGSQFLFWSAFAAAGFWLLGRHEAPSVVAASRRRLPSSPGSRRS